MPEGYPASVPGILDRLVATTGCLLALVASRVGEEYLVEECNPQPGLAGTRLKVPTAADGSTAERLDTASSRLPLDWTLACGTRPDYVISSVIGPDNRRLVLAGTGPAPALASVRFAADQAAALFAAGEGTQHDLALALHIRDLVDHLPFPVVFIDSNSFNALINDPARQLLGVAAGEMAEAKVHLALRAIMTEAGVEAAAAVSDANSDAVFDLVHAQQQYEVTVRAIDREGLVGRLWVFRNVTTEREAARFRDELIANVSHELRTPLTSIVGALSLLQGTIGRDTDPDAARLLTIARNNAGRLARLVDDLLDAGRLEARQLDIDPRPVDLGWLIADTVELNRPYADRLGITFAFARPRRRCLAQIDPDRMAQVLGNVLTNAAKFSPSGSAVDLTLEARRGIARIRVSDHGCGMTPEFQKRLFTRFARERDDKSRPPGTGLGLAIAKGIVEAMGGRIELESAVNRGTVVTLEVPLALAEPIKPQAR